MKTVFAVNISRYPYHKAYLDLFKRIAEEYGDVQIFDMASSEPLHEIYYKISAIWEDVFKLREDFPNVPNADWLEIPEECPLTGNIDQKNDVWVREWFAYIMKEAEILQTGTES